MNPIDPTTIERLSNLSDDEKLKVTLLAPMENSGRDVRKNEIHWKNVVREASELLAQEGIEEYEFDKWLSAAEAKLDDIEFWQNQTHGLAYFSDGEFSEFFAVGHRVAPAAFARNDFVIGPLIGSANDHETSYLIACSPKQVRLFKIESGQIELLQPDCLPENLRDALNIDEYTSSLQHHTTSSPNSGAPKAVFHGHGGSDPDVKKQDEILQYFHRLDDALESYFDKEDKLLIFAGVEYLFPIFKEACNYRNLHDEPITGNPDNLSPEQLLEKAKPILAEIANRKTTAVLDELHQKLHTEWASSSREDICKAAEIGQVEKLIVSPNTDLVELNKALTSTLRFGGEIYRIANDNDEYSEFISAAIFRSPAGSFLPSMKPRR